MNDERDIEEDLKPSTRDYIHTGIKAGLSTAPFIGGPIAEFFSFVIAPPLEKRRTEWLIEIYKRLQLLEKTSEDFKPENLAKNEKFFSVFLQATQIAMRTHQKEKLEALRNAVINSVIIPTIDENLQMIFLNLVDRYTPWHLTILQFSDNPGRYAKDHQIQYPIWALGGFSHMIEYTFKELQGRPFFYKQILKELVSDGLIKESEHFHAGKSGDGMFDARTTNLGKQFLNFIQNPITNNGNTL